MTIKLTVDNKAVVMPVGATISIEKNSPVLNDEVGAFSYPFAVPTVKNRVALSYPGRLERAKDIPIKSFVLDENGTKILTGEIEIDEVGDETGLTLQAGKTEFTTLMKDKYLGDIDYGHEEWPVGTTEIIEKLDYWDAANTTNNGKYVAAPYLVTPIPDDTNPLIGNGTTTVNQQLKVTGETKSTLDLFSGYEVRRGFFSLQFKISFLIRSIFLKSGYSITEDQFLTSEFNKAILFGNILEFEGGAVDEFEVPAHLEYSALMPKLKVLDFLKTVSGLFCVVFDVNELRREVSISFKKDIFLSENISPQNITELTGWKHKEHRPVDGFSLTYSSQDSALDTEFDYEIGSIVFYVIPAVSDEGSTVRVIIGSTPEDFVAGLPYYHRDYIVVKNDADVLEWKEIGRLRNYLEGNGDNEIELDINIPTQNINTFNYPSAETYECPGLYGTSFTGKSRIKSTSAAYISLYHGRKTFSGCLVPYTSFDRFSIDATIDIEMSMKPSYLYEKVYKEFINWQAFRARECTKYLKLSLSEVISLQWRKRYVVSGVPILFKQVSFEIPYTGIVRINGFTA